MERHTVTFDDDTRVTIEKPDDGVPEITAVEQIDEYDRFFEALSEFCDVDRGGKTYAFFGSGGTEIIDASSTGDVVSLAEDHGVKIYSLWPSYDEDGTDKAMYIALQ